MTVRLEALVSLLLVSASAVRSQPDDKGWVRERTHLGESELERGERGGPDAQKHFDAAERALEEALSMAPNAPDAIHALSSVYMRTGRTEEAAAILTKGIAGNPRSAPLHAKLGYVFRYAGMMEASIAEYRVSQTIDPSHENRISTERQIIKSLIYSGRYQDAFDAYDSILDWLAKVGRQPDEKIRFYQGLGRLYAGDTDHAVRLFEASIEARPDSLWSRFARAYSYGATGQTAKLNELADELARDNVSDGERRYRLAHLNALSGRSGEALAHLEGSARSGFFNFPYSKHDRLLESLEGSAALDEILAFIEQRHRRFTEQANRRGGSNGGVP